MTFDLTDEKAGLQIESLAKLNTRGVSTKRSHNPEPFRPDL